MLGKENDFSSLLRYGLLSSRRGVSRGGEDTVPWPVLGLPSSATYTVPKAMQRERIIETIRSHADELPRFDVQTLSLFGSVARDEAHEQSDVDLLVSFRGAATFGHYMGLKLFLEDLLGRRVDLVTKRALRHELRERVEREAIHVA